VAKYGYLRNQPSDRLLVDALPDELLAGMARAADDMGTSEIDAIYRGIVDFAAIQGTLVESGREGSAHPNVKDYDIPGYNHVYRRWEYQAAANSAVAFSFNLSAGEYVNPVFRIGNYTLATAPSTLALNGEELSNGADYVCSLDDSNDQLYLTLARTLSGNNTIAINTTATIVPEALPRTGFAPTDRGNTGEVYTLRGEAIRGNARNIAPGVYFARPGGPETRNAIPRKIAKVD
jgi:hypothetical protein